MRGEACDIGRNPNPDLTRDAAETCFQLCFPAGSYGQEENNAGPGTHFHFQTNENRSDVQGRPPLFAPGVVPRR